MTTEIILAAGFHTLLGRSVECRLYPAAADQASLEGDAPAEEEGQAQADKRGPARPPGTVRR